jgi:hypothetical protein
VTRFHSVGPNLLLDPGKEALSPNCGGFTGADLPDPAGRIGEPRANDLRIAI